MAALTDSVQTPESLKILAEQLGASARDLVSAAEGMKSLRLDALKISHDNSRVIGWKSVNAYITAVKNAMADAGTKRVPPEDTDAASKRLKGRQRTRKQKGGDTDKGS